MLLTNDGDLASKLTHPKYLKKKIYHVHLDKNLTKADTVLAVVDFAGLTKKGLRRGEWRYLTEQEVNFLRMGSLDRKSVV